MRKRGCSILASRKCHHNFRIITQVQEAGIDSKKSDGVDFGAEECQSSRGEIQSVITGRVLHSFGEEGGISVEGYTECESITALHSGILARAMHRVGIRLREFEEIKPKSRWAREKQKDKDKQEEEGRIHEDPREEWSCRKRSEKQRNWAEM